MRTGVLTQGILKGVISFSLTLILVLLGLNYFYEITAKTQVSNFMQQSVHTSKVAEQDFQAMESQILSHISKKTLDFSKTLRRAPKVVFRAKDDFPVRMGLDTGTNFRDLLEHRENDIMLPWRQRYLLRLKNLHRECIKQFPILEMGDDKPQLFWVQFFSTELMIQYYHYFGSAPNSRLSEYMKAELWTNNLLPANETFLTNTLISMVSRGELVSVIQAQFLRPAETLYNIDSSGNNPDFFPITILNTYGHLQILRIPPSQDRLDTIYPDLSPTPAMGWFFSLLDSQRLLLKFLEERTQNQAMQWSVFPLLLQNSATIPEHIPSQVELLHAVNNGPTGEFLSREELYDRMKRVQITKFRYLKNQRYIMAIAIQDTIHKRLVHMFEVSMDSLMENAYQTILIWLQATFIPIFLFFAFTITLLYYLIRPLRSLAIHAQRISEDLNNIPDPVSTDTPFHEVNILARNLNRYSTAVSEQLKILETLMQLQKRIQKNETPKSNQAWVHEAVPDLPSRDNSLNSNSLIRLLLKASQSSQILTREQILPAFWGTLIFDEQKEMLKETALKAEQQRNELELASLVQKNLLEQSLNTASGIESYFYYEPARYLGGDFYFHLSLPDKPSLYVIADVSGKGLAASLYGAKVHALMDALWPHCQNVSQLMIRVNQELCRESVEGFFCTAFLLSIDLKNQTFSYASAGHNRMLCFMENSVVELSGKGLPLGIFDAMQYPEKTEPLSVCSGFLLYTDGLNEAENSSQELYGMDRLFTHLKNNPPQNQSPQKVIEDLILDLKSFTRDTEPSDDNTLIAIKIVP
ncbi:MAG: serine/threonine-protein phosphatase [Candidatus Cloacimonetes bacterium]|nr:serine/threonine-protein phosphatase [Candidatus Cloacimonadota bacterium]